MLLCRSPLTPSGEQVLIEINEIIAEKMFPESSQGLSMKVLNIQNLVLKEKHQENIYGIKTEQSF